MGMVGAACGVKPIPLKRRHTFVEQSKRYVTIS
jgi:hypothetical protein